LIFFYKVKESRGLGLVHPMKKQAASPTKRRLSDLERHLTSSDDKHGIAAGTASVLAAARGKWHGVDPLSVDINVLN